MVPGAMDFKPILGVSGTVLSAEEDDAGNTYPALWHIGSAFFFRIREPVSR
jgi:hypothetical protein